MKLNDEQLDWLVRRAAYWEDKMCSERLSSPDITVDYRKWESRFEEVWQIAQHLGGIDRFREWQGKIANVRWEKEKKVSNTQKTTTVTSAHKGTNTNSVLARWNFKDVEYAMVVGRNATGLPQMELCKERVDAEGRPYWCRISIVG